MSSKFRKSPPVCLLTALIGLISGKLRLSKEHLGNQVNLENGKEFEVFRDIGIAKSPEHLPRAGRGEGGFRGMSEEETLVNQSEKKVNTKPVAFAVTFKFARLTHRQNKIASIIPMLMIAGFPGFVRKVYGVDAKEGFWMGLYQWRSPQHLEAYKKSLVFRVMQKRAIKESISMHDNPRLSQPITKL